MRYLLAIATLLAGVTFPSTLRGQSVAVNFGRSAPGGWTLPASLHNGGFGFRPFLGGPRTVVFPPFFGYPSNYPFEYFYPGLWPPLEYQHQQASLIAHGDVAAEVADQEKTYLSSQVQALTDEVRSLRGMQASQQFGQVPGAVSRPEIPLHPQAQSKAQHEFPSTIFIYRDGRELEARDYAILGETLWVFRGETSRKFPLSDFNLAASRQVNEEHGVEFPLSDRP